MNTHCPRCLFTFGYPQRHAGAQFVLSVRIYEANKKCGPTLAKRQGGLSYAAMQWALQSDSQDGFLPLVISQSVRAGLCRPLHTCRQSATALLAAARQAWPPLCVCARCTDCCAQPSWASLRDLGVPLWLKNDEELRKIVERCAKTQVRGPSLCGAQGAPCKRCPQCRPFSCPQNPCLTLLPRLRHGGVPFRCAVLGSTPTRSETPSQPCCCMWPWDPASTPS